MTDVRKAHRSRIVEPLERLVRSRSGAPFVVITDRMSGKFVQFFGSSSEPLFLTLPCSQLLMSDEQARASRMLGEPKLMKMGPRSPRTFLVFRSAPFVGGDVEAASGLALEVMEEVFHAELDDLKVEFRRS
jgi:hypothetical protein